LALSLIGVTVHGPPQSIATFAERKATIGAMSPVSRQRPVNGYFIGLGIVLLALTGLLYWL